jgi:hypothetical protein
MKKEGGFSAAQGLAEENFYNIEALKESAYRYGQHFKERAKNLEEEISLFRRILIALFAFVLVAMVISIYYAERYGLDVSTFTRFGVFAFLISVFWWVARLYNQLRQLRIFYLDKYILAETYCMFVRNSDDKESHTFVREAGVERLFSSSLEVGSKFIKNNHHKR